MKLVRYGPVHQELPGLIDSAGRLRALSPLVADIGCDNLTLQWLSLLRAIDPEKLPLVEGHPRLGIPISGIRQIIAIGLNYRDHAIEAGFDIPEYPLVFLKSVGSLSGSDDPVLIPPGVEKLDWEVELGFLINGEGRDIPVERALDYVGGYCCAVDVSERAWQFDRGGAIGKGKSLDSFTPVGPWLVTSDEVGDPQKLDLWLDINNEPRQRGKTSEMIFSVAEIIAHVSAYQTLLPGDLVITGTPAGVALGMKPPRFLEVGDKFACGITGLGQQSHTVLSLNHSLKGERDRTSSSEETVKA